MWPVIFSLGSVNFYTFGFLLAIGFFIFAFITWRRLFDLGLKEERIIDLILLMTFFGFLLARLFYIGIHFKEFGFFFDRWLWWGRYPGFSFWGGVTGLFLGLIWYCRRQKWDFWRIADEVSFGLLPLLALINLGAFFDGSISGRPTAMPWGVFFPGSLVRQEPVSLFAAILFLGIWLFLARAERQLRIWKWYKGKTSGLVFLVFLTLCLFFNFLLAFLKFSPLYFYWSEISLSLLGAVLGLVLIYHRSGRNLKEDLWSKRKPQ